MDGTFVWEIQPSSLPSLGFPFFASVFHLECRYSADSTQEITSIVFSCFIAQAALPSQGCHVANGKIIVEFNRPGEYS